MGQFASLRTQKIESFEELNEVVLGARREIVQLETGRIAGQLVHASIGDLPIDVASFNLGIRSRGVSHPDRIGICMLAESGARATRSSYDSRTGDVLVMQPGCEHENRYFGGASVIVVMPSAADIASSFGSEPAICDPTSWRGSHFKGNAETVKTIIPRLKSLIGRLGNVSLTAQATAFWKRAVIEAIAANIVSGLPAEREGPLPSALKLVRRVEDYLEQAQNPVHISQICGHLHISRRTLHRAFHEALGIGPIAFLRHRRLCAVHTALRSGPPQGTISDLAMQHGFQDLGRFARYYRQLFGENPSETRRIHQPLHLWSRANATNLSSKLRRIPL